MRVSARVCQIQLLNQLADFHEIWYEPYAICVHTNAVIYTGIFSQSLRDAEIMRGSRACGTCGITTVSNEKLELDM
jgi:hypothetical protein